MEFRIQVSWKIQSEFHKTGDEHATITTRKKKRNRLRLQFQSNNTNTHKHTHTQKENIIAKNFALRIYCKVYVFCVKLYRKLAKVLVRLFFIFVFYFASFSCWFFVSFNPFKNSNGSNRLKRKI